MFIEELYQQTVAANERNLRFWDDYLNSLKSLDLNIYAEKLKVPTLVPIGSRIFFRGELKHTNEVTVCLGADYFVKCSIKQAEVLRQHRIKDAQSKVDLLTKEKEYLENQISFTKQNLYETEGQEIVEVYTEEEDKIWRDVHRENVRKYKQGKVKDEIKPKDDKTDDELWERLEELELQEELENEMFDNYNEIVDKRKENSFLVNEETLLLNSFKENSTHTEAVESKQEENNVNAKTIDEAKVIKNREEITDEDNAPKQSAKLELLQQVLDKQNELENKLHELKYREREQSRTEQDLISKLDEIEQLDELEDEIDRLDDILQTEDAESDDDSNKSDSTKLKRSISFADEDDSRTIDITFTHSDMEPNNEPYNPEKGILKPSDVYEAYSHLYGNKTTSILKKSKYEVGSEKEVKQIKKVGFAESMETPEDPEPKEILVDRTIIIKDVVEKGVDTQKKLEYGARPTSLFKKKRMQNKT